MELPQNLYQNLKSLFGDDFHEFYALKDEPSYKGLRVNTLKCSVPKLLEYGITKSPSPFCASGFYISGEEKLGNHPLHHAGAFYIQEPSATSAVEVLNPTVGDYVLDLCAAPGGKSTQIAAKLSGSGLIWSNEIIGKRANILLSNFERMGIHNCVVSSCHPDILCDSLECAFDKVLVDAPCSGEGMMRHDASICEDWSSENVDACARRQLKILDSAAKALKSGGILVYSTCTFSRAENEDVTEKFLQTHPEFSPEEINVTFGRKGFSGNHTRRILWNDGGEGHFIAKFKKSGNEPRRDISGAKPTENELLSGFLAENGITLPEGVIQRFADKFFLSPDIADFPDLGILRKGLYLGELSKNRIIPQHSMFSCPSVKCEKEIDLILGDSRTAQFLHGDEIDANSLDKGFCRVKIEGIPCSFGKLSSGRLKNYYPKGLRNLK